MEEIRRLGAGDSFEELTGLLHRAYARLGALGLNYTAVDQPVHVTRARALDGECFVVVQDGRIVGTATVALAAEMRDPPPCVRPGLAYLGQFAVDPPLQARGLGSRLLAAVEARARERGADAIALDTAEGAEHLIRFYAARGYGAAGHARFPGKAYRSVILSKPLAATRGKPP
jgi:GNAT superfamily N-acetyltransferase